MEVLKHWDSLQALVNSEYVYQRSASSRMSLALLRWTVSQNNSIGNETRNIGTLLASTAP